MSQKQTHDGRLCIFVLAAGHGIRMKSDTSKVFFPFFGKPLLEHVLKAAQSLKPDKLVTVISPKDYQQAVELFGSIAELAIQKEAKGTGDAVRQAWEIAPEEDFYLILCGDTPLIKPQTLQSLADIFFKSHADAAMITAKVAQPKRYGRIIRNEQGDFQEIVEYKDASAEEKKILEVNAGMYLFRREALEKTLFCLNSQNAAQEVYLTDTLKDIRRNGGKISIHHLEGENEIFGINNRKDLSVALSIAYHEKNESLMLEDGVSIIDPNHTFIDPQISIGQDSIIKPYCYLEGPVSIGRNVSIGPFVCIRATEKDPVFIESQAQVGPFTSIRGGTCLKDQVHVGSFVELKKSILGEKSKAMHLSYLGDAEIGENVNVGAGTITCNYDGEKKYKTIIHDGAFIGSDAILVAPLSIGRESYIAAGSTITQDVPDHSLGIGRSRQVNKVGWKKRHIRIKDESETKKEEKRNGP